MSYYYDYDKLLIHYKCGSIVKVKNLIREVGRKSGAVNPDRNHIEVFCPKCGDNLTMTSRECAELDNIYQRQMRVFTNDLKPGIYMLDGKIFQICDYCNSTIYYAEDISVGEVFKCKYCKAGLLRYVNPKEDLKKHFPEVPEYYKRLRK